MTQRAIGWLVLLATVFFAAHGALAASCFLEESPPFFMCKAIELVVYAFAAIVVLRDEEGNPALRKRALVLIGATAVVFRFMLLFTPPDSTDINRYIWDGRVQAAQINPYVYIPADPALKFLRDDEIYPEINRATYAPTIYPPLAQILFFLVTRVSETITAMKGAMLVCEAVAVWAILRLLKARGLPATRSLIYLWHPLPIYEFSGSGHVDAAAIACVLLALLATELKRPFLAGIALGGATLVKFFPVVIGPALYRRWDWRLPLAGAATLVFLYLPYVGAGRQIFGFLGGYSDEEGLQDGSGLYFWLLLQHLLPVPASASRLYFPAAALILAGCGLAVLFKRRLPGADLGATLLLAGMITVVTSPHYPWYLAWLIPMLCFVPCWSIFYLTGASYLIYVVDWPSSFVGGSILYGPFLGLLAIEMAMSIWRGRVPPHEAATA